MIIRILLVDNLLLLLQDLWRLCHLSKFILESSILLWSSINTFWPWLQSFLILICINFVVLIVDVFNILIIKNLRFSQIITVFFSDIQWFMSQNIILIIFLSSLVLLQSGFYNLLIVIILIRAFIKLFLFLRNHFMNSTFRIFLLWQ